MNIESAGCHKHEPRTGALLVVLAILFVLHPLLAASHIGSAVLDMCLSSALLLTVRALRDCHRAMSVAALSLSLLAIAAALGSHLFQVEVLLPLGHVLGVLFFLMTGTLLLGRVLEAGPVTSNRLHAAVCGYLLIGLGWGLVFSTMEHVHPGTFLDASGNPSASHAVLAGFPHLTYFSFATLTTLGFGDIVPISPLARSLSALAAVTGQLYLALLVARLVGLHIARLSAVDNNQRGREPDEPV